MPPPLLVCFLSLFATGFVMAAQPLRIAYKHTSKTGGQYVEHIISRIFKKEDYIFYGEGANAAMTRNDSFLIGTVRNPCDWLASMWGYSWRMGCKGMYAPKCKLWEGPRDQRPNFAGVHYWNEKGACLDLQTASHCIDEMYGVCLRKRAKPPGLPISRSEKTGFEAHREWMKDPTFAAARTEFREYVTDGRTVLDEARVREACPGGGVDSTEDFADWAHRHIDDEMSMMRAFFIQPGMPPNFHEAFRAGQPWALTLARPEYLADCWVTTENEYLGLLKCFRAYEQRGGIIDWEKVGQFAKPQKLNPSVHRNCSSLFDLSNQAPGGIAETVYRTQRSLFDTFKYPSCCSNSNM